jgi:tetratricopeptide (TPR) repeat protein
MIPDRTRLRRPARAIVPALAVFLVAAPAPLAADHGPGEVLGRVHFPSRCEPKVQPALERAVALLHSFGYEPAREAFAAVADDDPRCALAHWGIAMTQYHPLWAAPTPAELAVGAEAANRAAALAAADGVSERERAYVAAIGRFYADAEAADHKTRAGRYRDAMAELAGRFPDDPDATLFYALSLLGTAPPTDPERAQQKRAVDLLVPLVAKLPDHPGVAHYMIHGLDYPELAASGLDAARRYARIAPASPHALHMPSHVFVRLGLWPEAIASNRDSASSARARASKFPVFAAYETLHALDYLAYAYLQTGQDDEARAVLEEAASLVGVHEEPTFQAAYAVAAIPARYALERGQWAEAAALPVVKAKGGASDRYVADRYAYAPAMTWYAKALGAARAGDVASAEVALAALGGEQQKLAQAPPPGPYDWAGYVESQRLSAAGWIAHAKGRSDAAIDLLRQAAALEAKVGKHPVTPGSVLPARELLGDLLLELGRPREALAEYESSLVTTPNRLRSLEGAAKAAELAGEADRGKTLRNLIAALTAAGTRYAGRSADAPTRSGG